MDYNSDSWSAALVTVVETPEFLSRVDKLLTEPEHDELVAYLASNPMAGDLIQGTGGVRKLRWALAGRGKRGGARVVYFYRTVDHPLFALTIFAKNERADLTERDRSDLRRLTTALKNTYRRTRR